MKETKIKFLYSLQFVCAWAQHIWTVLTVYIQWTAQIQCMAGFKNTDICCNRIVMNALCDRSGLQDARNT